MSVLYRVENPHTMQGLWFDRNASYNGFIRQFGDALCHDVPMGFDPQFLTDGHWFSACDNLADMSSWFSLSDLKRLHSIGYDLYRIEVPTYRTINGHAAFLRKNATAFERVTMGLINEGWKTNDS